MISTILILVLLIYIFYDNIRAQCISFFHSKTIKSKVDGNEYSVITLYENQQEASNIIAEINKFTVAVISRLKQKYLTISPSTPEQIKGYESASILEKRYSHKNLSENEPTSDKDTSYTQNKGEIIAICIREKQSGQNKFHSMDVIKFVMLHELAHIITPEIQHTDLFWTNFRFLLEFCQREGLYTAPNYNIKPEVYCGMTIKYNPVYDNYRTTTYFS